jgi:murein DD-endopeptidase MepM/ murein hydrolase activator NlpD
MKWLLTLIVGAVLGAAGLFVYLRQVPHDTVVATVPTTSAVTTTGPAVVAPAAAPAPGSAAAIEPNLPPAPQVPTDLTELDLPIKPTADEAALKTVPALPAGASTSTASAPAETASTSTAPSSATSKLLIPVEGIKYAQMTDTFNQPRGTERHHEALDIMAAKGSKVFAVNDGKVVKLFNSKPGGLTIYQFDPSNTYAYYYAHLDRYADGVKEGMQLKRGDLIGYVGTTGNARTDAPHLHFAVVELTPAKQWWKGTSINPYPMFAQK